MKVALCAVPSFSSTWNMRRVPAHVFDVCQP